MASTYQDLLVRGRLGETNSMPRNASSASPDLIPYGLDLAQDPQATFGSAAAYGADQGKALIANGQNYLYMRAKNYAPAEEKGKAYLYYAKSSLLLYSDQWENNKLETSQGVDHVELDAKANGDIVVTADPFVWSPEVPGSGWHYCLVGRVATDTNPNPIFQTGSIQDFGAWIAENGGLGWRNVSVVSTGAPTWTNNTKYDQGDQAAMVKFFLTCTNVTAGSSVSFSAGTPTPDGPVALPKTQVTDSRSFIVGIQKNIEANWNTDFAYSFWANGNPQPGFNISLSAAIVVPPDLKDLYQLAKTPAELGMQHALDHDAKSGKLKMLTETIGPGRMIILGECHTNGVAEESLAKGSLTSLGVHEG